MNKIYHFSKITRLFIYVVYISYFKMFQYNESHLFHI